MYTTLVFLFHCTWHLYVSLRFVCAPTLMQPCFDTDRLFNPLQPLIMPLCLHACVFIKGDTCRKELKVEPLTALPPVLFVLCAQTGCADSFVLVIQIIVLMPIRSITSGEHEDITTPTYSKVKALASPDTALLSAEPTMIHYLIHFPPFVCWLLVSSFNETGIIFNSPSDTNMWFKRQADVIV